MRWADADAGNILAGTATELVLNHKRGQVLPVGPPGARATLRAELLLTAAN